jgi:putative MATE family efflux protein
LPVLGQQVLTLAVALSDRFLAGHVPDAAPQSALQAAQTTANYLAWFLSSYTVFVSAGSTALVARFVGGGDRAGAVRVANQSLLLALLFGLGGSGVGLVVLGELVRLLQLQGESARLAVDYLQPLLTLLTFQVVQAAGVACLVGAGDTRTGLAVTAGVAFVNLPISWLLAWGWGPVPAAGFVGIARGTALSFALGGIAVTYVLCRGRAGLHYEWRQLHPDRELLRRLLWIGVPAGIDNLSLVAGQLWFLSLINRLGNTAASAHGIAIGWEALGYLSGGAFGVAAMALVGQQLGAGRPERAARAGWVAFGLGCGMMSIMGATFFILAPAMFALFCPHSDQKPIIDEGVPVLRLVAFAMPPLASCIIFTYALRGAGDTRIPVIFTWVGFLVVRIPLAYLLTSEAVGFGLFGAWLAMFADLVVRGGFFLSRFAGGRWQLVRV